MIDALEIAACAFEEDLGDELKTKATIDKQEDLRKHYDALEQNTCQISHINWLKLGDGHTTFFGNVTQERRTTNFLLNLTNSKGEAYLSIREAKSRCVDFYNDLFTKPSKNSSFRPWFLKVITSEINVWLMRIPHLDEVKRVSTIWKRRRPLDPTDLPSKSFRFVKTDLWNGLAH